MSATRIPYLDAVWNPWLGCTRTGRAKCQKCWALPMLERRQGIPEGTVRRASETTWKSLRRVKAGSVVGVCFLSDFFHEAADQWRLEAWEELAAASERGLTLVVPTTRPQLIEDAFPDWWDALPGRVFERVYWLISIGNQADADELLPIALRVPVGHVVVSYEPALGPVVLRAEWLHMGCRPTMDMPPGSGRIEGVIFGCESGPGARWGGENWTAARGACHRVIDWAHSCRDQCAVAGVAFYLKQLPLGPGVMGESRKGIVERPVLDGRQWLNLPWQKGVTA